jgi:hypothetical protein
LVKGGSSTGILQIMTENRLSSPSDVLESWLVRIILQDYLRMGDLPIIYKSFICFSYVICAFTYHIVQLVFVLSYIRSRV